jgi:hypothetical protein
MVPFAFIIALFALRWNQCVLLLLLHTSFFIKHNLNVSTIATTYDAAQLAFIYASCVEAYDAYFLPSFDDALRKFVASIGMFLVWFLGLSRLARTLKRNDCQVNAGTRRSNNRDRKQHRPQKRRRPSAKDKKRRLAEYKLRRVVQRCRARRRSFPHYLNQNRKFYECRRATRIKNLRNFHHYRYGPSCLRWLPTFVQRFLVLPAHRKFMIRQARLYNWAKRHIKPWLDRARSFVTRNGVRIASLPLLRDILCRYMSDDVVGEVFSKLEAEQILRSRRQEIQRRSNRRTLAKCKRHQFIRTAKKRFTKRIRNPIVAFILFVLRPVKCLWSFLVLFTRHTCSGLKNDALFWICLLAIPMFLIFAKRRSVFVHMPHHHSTCSTSAAEAEVDNGKDEAKVDDEGMAHDDDEDDDADNTCGENTDDDCVNLLFDLPWTEAEPASLPTICIAKCHSILNLKASPFHPE